MDKIKERAAEYTLARREDWMPEDCYSSDLFDGYVKGAKEQKKIDVEKACGILWDMCLTRRDEFKTYKDVITTFRKAMEGIIGNKEEIPSKLTWQDIEKIENILTDMFCEYVGRNDFQKEAYYTEVLKRFNESKEG